MSDPNRKRPLNTALSNTNKRLHRTTSGVEQVQNNTEAEYESFGSQRSQATRRTLYQQPQQQQQQQQGSQNYSTANFSSSGRVSQAMPRKSIVLPPMTAKSRAILERYKSHVDNPPSFPKNLKEPASIKQPETQRRCLKFITESLKEVGYPSQLPIPRLYRELGSVNFQAMFKHLVKHLLPDYKFEKKFEEDIFEVMRTLRYPYADSISPKSLLSIGALHSTPTFFNLLTWLSVYGKTMDVMVEKIQDRKRVEAENRAAGVFDRDRLLQVYALETYHKFMQGKDFEEENQKLADAYVSINEQNRAMIDEFTVENAELRQTLEDLKAQEQRLLKAKNRNEDLKHDCAFYQKQYEAKREKAEKYKALNQNVAEEMTILKQKYAEKEEERDQLRRILADRNVSEEKVLALENKNAELLKVASEIEEEIQKWNQAISEKEARTINIRHQVQSSVDERNKFVQNIPIPPTTSLDPNKDHPFQIIYNPQGTTVEGAVGPDQNFVISAELQKMEENLRAEHEAIMGELYALREQIESFKTSIMEKQSEEKELRERLEAKSKYFNKVHAEAQEQNRKYNEDKDRREQEINQRKKQVDNLVFENNQKLQDAISSSNKAKSEMKEKEENIDRKMQSVCLELEKMIKRLTAATEEAQVRGYKELQKLMKDIQQLKLVSEK